MPSTNAFVFFFNIIVIFISSIKYDYAVKEGAASEQVFHGLDPAHGPTQVVHASKLI